jgi:hypothetical protein
MTPALFLALELLAPALWATANNCEDANRHIGRFESYLRYLEFS